MSSFFGNALGVNPFSTPVGSKIEQATDGTLASENWALNMEICDMINETEEGPKDAIKAIRKRLTQNAGKNYAVVMYTLTVLETCVKNCGKRFHVLACSKDFVQELVKLIGPKNDPPTAVQEKVLSLIQSWADAFKQQPDLFGVASVYQDLLNKGIEFPATDLDAMAPIFTPQRSVEAAVPPPVEPQVSNTVVPNIPSPSGGILTIEQRAKLQSELDVVQSNMAVFGEMLNEMQPGNEQPDELELLQELNGTCHGMQERLVELIGRLSNDELTAELLRINDDLNNLFLRYSRWEKNREVGSNSASAILGKAISSNVKNAPVPDAEASLIDLGPSDVSDQLSKLRMSSASASAQLSQIDTVTARNGSQKDDEFGVFAQSRNASSQDPSKTRGSLYKDNLNPNQVSGGLNSVLQGRQQTSRDSDFDEMAAWLGDAAVEESVTSSEFEKFLAERAAAADTLPAVTATTTSTSNVNMSSTQSQSTKDSKKEGLLAL